jgi:hypothetical protein
VDDRISLEGASKDQLRKRFKQVRKQATAEKYHPRTTDGEPCYGSQHRYFIQVDEQSLQDLHNWT